MKKVNRTTAEYIKEMQESARKLEVKCNVASDFNDFILERYKYNYMKIARDDADNYIVDADGNYVYMDREENDWNYEEGKIAKEIVNAIEKALENYCFLD